MALTLVIFLKIAFRFAAISVYSNVEDTSTFTMTSNYEFRVTGFVTFLILDRVGIELISLVTCCLTCTRAITVWAPFYRIRETLVYVTLGIYLVAMVPRETFYVYNFTYLNYMFEDGTSYDSFKHARYGLLTVMLVVVMVASGMVVTKLSLNKRLTESSTRNASKATITTLILAGSFVFWNAWYVHVQLYAVIFLEVDELSSFTSGGVYRFGLWIAIPMDALCSPIIYFIRIRQMRGLFLALVFRQPYIDDTRAVGTQERRGGTQDRKGSGAAKLGNTASEKKGSVKQCEVVENTGITDIKKHFSSSGTPQDNAPATTSHC